MKAIEIEKALADKLFRDAYGKAWDRVKHATLWQSGKPGSYGYVELANGCVPDWNWSCTFNRWGASVKLIDGWVGFTYPKSS